MLLYNMLVTLSRLQPQATVLDLGCGRGSFHYAAYPFATLAMDVSLPDPDLRQTGSRIHYFRGDSSALPLPDHSVDMVISHHTMEHFPDYRTTLKEIGRVLKPGGFLWIAVPNGRGFDDALYRFVFSGGGHVNRFTYEGLVADVKRLTGLTLIQSCDLFSSFIYLKKPDPRELQFYPPSARFLDNMPEGFLVNGALAINTATRLADKLLGTRWSQYGWGFIFGQSSSEHQELPSHFNVCRRCGTGSAATVLKQTAGRALLGLRLYKCPHCSERNILVPPLPGTQ